DFIGVFNVAASVAVHAKRQAVLLLAKARELFKGAGQVLPLLPAEPLRARLVKPPGNAHPQRVAPVGDQDVARAQGSQELRDRFDVGTFRLQPALFPQIDGHKGGSQGQAPAPKELGQPLGIRRQVPPGPKLGPLVPRPGHLVQHPLIGQLGTPARNLAHAPADGRVANSHGASPRKTPPGSSWTGRPLSNERCAATAMASAFSPSSTPTGGGAPRRTASTKASSSRR